jgi:hypothetical protein
MPFQSFSEQNRLNLRLRRGRYAYGYQTSLSPRFEVFMDEYVIMAKSVPMGFQDVGFVARRYVAQRFSDDLG